MPITIPYRFTPDEVADADQVNANFDAIDAYHDGGHTDADISDTADINSALKLSSTPSKQATEPKLGTNSVSDRVLSKDAGAPGNDSSRAVSADHIKAIPAGGVNTGLQRILPASGIGTDKLAVTIHTVAFNFNATGAAGAGLITTNAVPPSSNFDKTIWDLKAIFIKNHTPPSNTLVQAIANDAGANWSGSVVALNALDTGGAQNVSGTVVYVFMKKVAP